MKRRCWGQELANLKVGIVTKPSGGVTKGKPSGKLTCESKWEMKEGQITTGICSWGVILHCLLNLHLVLAILKKKNTPTENTSVPTSLKTTAKTRWWLHHRVVSVFCAASGAQPACTHKIPLCCSNRSRTRYKPCFTDNRNLLDDFQTNLKKLSTYTVLCLNKRLSCLPKLAPQSVMLTPAMWHSAKAKARLRLWSDRYFWLQVRR